MNRCLHLVVFLFVMNVAALGCAATASSPDAGTSDVQADAATIELEADAAVAQQSDASVAQQSDASVSSFDASVPLPDAAPSFDAGPDWIVGGVAICPEVAGFRNTANDSAAVLQVCIDRTPLGMALEIEAGRYSLAGQLRLDRAMTLRTRNSVGTGPCAATAGHSCMELFALPSFTAQFGMFRATAGATVDHVVINGNRQGRTGTASYNMCADLSDNTRGFNATLDCSACTVTNSVSMNALCGTGLLVIGPGNAVTVRNSTFAYNGVHNATNLWADGLTVLEAADATFSDNTFIDNTDIDLIFGGCPRCLIQNNTVTHTTNVAGGAFAAIMIQKWPGTSGNYEDVLVSNNLVNCGPSRLCGSGLYIGSEGWYEGTPHGSLVPGTTSGLITNNTIQNTMNALYIAARGMAIYGNNFVNSHGMAIPNNCGQQLVSGTPIIVSPTTTSCHFNGENVDPATSIHYGGANWTGCIPNWPF